MTSEPRHGGEMGVSLADMLAPVQGQAWPEFAGLTVLRCNTGRAALRLALEDWRQVAGQGGTLWIPDYLCPSIPALADAMAVRLRTYADRPGGHGLERPPEPGNGDAVLLVHYFGQVNAPMLDWLRQCGQRRWTVVEDCVQSPYSGGVGQSGDYAITSLRKWWGVPDGATLHHRNPLRGAALHGADEAFVSQRLAAQMLAAASLGEQQRLAWIGESEARLDDNVARCCSWIAQQLIGRADRDGAIQRRRHNWLALQGALQALDLAGLEPVHALLAPDEVPLVYPVRIRAGRRDAVRRQLAGNRIYCPVHWVLQGECSAESRRLSDEMLGLPVDQRYGPADMVHLAGVLENIFKRSQNEH